LYQHEVKSLFAFLRTMLRTEQENDDGVFSLLDLVLGNSIAGHTIDDYLDVIVQLQYGQKETRVFGFIRTSVWLYGDVGLRKSDDRCPKATRDLIRSTLEQQKIVFWPLHVASGRVGHWVLAVMYPGAKRICLFDSSCDDKSLREIGEVRVLDSMSMEHE
jgi:hypothetical protein